MKNVLLYIGVVILALVFINIVSATPDPKVFVCKYVGTPGVDERLQTGQNPISVSQNAIKDFQGIGSYFNDKHGRSYVLSFDTGQEEPGVAQCPAPEVPPKEDPDPETPQVDNPPVVTPDTEETPSDPQNTVEEQFEGK